MKKLFSVFMFALAMPSAAVQAQYSVSYQNSQDVTKRMERIAIDNSGNTIVGGYFRSTLTFGTQTVTNNFPGDGVIWFSGNDIFIAKRNSSGTWLWAKNIILNDGGEMLLEKITTDAAGNIYITGNLLGSASFDNVATLVSQGRDMFTAKMSPNGNFLWAKKDGSAQFWEIGHSVAVDNSGNVYATGSIIDKQFKNCNGTRNFFYVVKYSSSGVKVWEKKYTVSQNTCASEEGTDIVTDGSDIYVTGSFTGTVNFGGSNTFNASSNGSTILLKLNSSGNTIWAKSIATETFTGISNTSGPILLLDNANQDIYLSGLYTGTVSFGSNSLTSNGNFFLAKYSTSTGTCSWAVNAGNVGMARTFKYPNGNIGIPTVDSMWGIREFSPAGVLMNTTTSSALRAGSQIIASVNTRDVVGTNNGFILCQSLAGSYTIDGTTVAAVAQYGTTPARRDMVVLQYTTPPPPAPKLQLGVSGASSESVSVYPNPMQQTLRIEDKRVLGSVRITDFSGRLVMSTQIGSSTADLNLAHLPAGIYLIKAEHWERPVKVQKL